jgi:hypothetical protein
MRDGLRDELLYRNAVSIKSKHLECFLAEQNPLHHKPAKDCRFNELSAWVSLHHSYGHSRLRELAFGGGTRTLLGEMTVPVLMSH